MICQLPTKTSFVLVSLFKNSAITVSVDLGLACGEYKNSFFRYSLVLSAPADNTWCEVKVVYVSVDA